MRLSWLKFTKFTVIALMAAGAKTAHAYNLSPISFANFYQIAAEGDLQGLKNVEHRGLNLNSTNQNGDTAVCVAIKRKDYLAYKTLIRAGAKSNPDCVERIPEYAHKNFLANYNQKYAAPKTPINWTKSGTAFVVGGGIAAGVVAAAGLGGGGGGGSKGGSDDSGDTSACAMNPCAEGCYENLTCPSGYQCTQYESKCNKGCIKCEPKAECVNVPECTKGCYNELTCGEGYQCAAINKCGGCERCEKKTECQKKPCAQGCYRDLTCGEDKVCTSKNSCGGCEKCELVIPDTPDTSNARHCLIYNTATNYCDTCREGYTSVNGTCRLDKPENCSEYSYDTEKCTECENGYKLSSDGRKCEKNGSSSGDTGTCTAANYPLSVCPSTASKCDSCTPEGASAPIYKIVTCNTGYQLSSDKKSCVAIPAGTCTAANYPLTSQPANAVFESCTDGSTTRYKITSCNTNYQLSSDGKSCVASDSTEICTAANYPLTSQPANAVFESCTDGSTTRYKITSCNANYQLSSDGKSCVASSSSEICTAANYPLTSQPANAVFESCTDGSTTRYKITSCNANYQLSSDGKSCVASSSSEICTAANYPLTSEPENAAFEFCENSGTIRYKITSCNIGYQLSEDKLSCVQSSSCDTSVYDLTECPEGTICERCVEREKVYYKFTGCVAGYEQTENTCNLTAINDVTLQNLTTPTSNDYISLDKDSTKTVSADSNNLNSNFDNLSTDDTYREVQTIGNVIFTNFSHDTNPTSIFNSYNKSSYIKVNINKQSQITFDDIIGLSFVSDSTKFIVNSYGGNQGVITMKNTYSGFGQALYGILLPERAATIVQGYNAYNGIGEINIESTTENSKVKLIGMGTKKFNSSSYRNVLINSQGSISGKISITAKAGTVYGMNGASLFNAYSGDSYSTTASISLKNSNGDAIGMYGLENGLIANSYIVQGASSSSGAITIDNIGNSIAATGIKSSTGSASNVFNSYSNGGKGVSVGNIAITGKGIGISSYGNGLIFNAYAKNSSQANKGTIEITGNSGVGIENNGSGAIFNAYQSGGTGTTTGTVTINGTGVGIANNNSGSGVIFNGYGSNATGNIEIKSTDAAADGVVVGMYSASNVSDSYNGYSKGKGNITITMAKQVNAFKDDTKATIYGTYGLIHNGSDNGGVGTITISDTGQNNVIGMYNGYNHKSSTINIVSSLNSSLLTAKDGVTGIFSDLMPAINNGTIIITMNGSAKASGITSNKSVATSEDSKITINSIVAKTNSNYGIYQYSDGGTYGDEVVINNGGIYLSFNKLTGTGYGIYSSGYIQNIGAVNVYYAKYGYGLHSLNPNNNTNSGNVKISALGATGLTNVSNKVGGQVTLEQLTDSSVIMTTLRPEGYTDLISLTNGSKEHPAVNNTDISKGYITLSVGSTVSSDFVGIGMNSDSDNVNIYNYGLIDLNMSTNGEKIIGISHNYSGNINNDGYIKINSLKTNAVGILGSKSTNIINNKNIYIQVNYSSAIGIEANNNSSVTNSGIIEIKSNGLGNKAVYGIYGINNKNDEYLDGSGVILNSGSIEISDVTGGNVYGIYADQYKIINKGNITLSDVDKSTSYGIYAINGSKVYNSGTITINDESYNKNEADGKFIYVDGTSSIVNDGEIATPTVTFNTAAIGGGKFVMGKNGKIRAPKVKGDITADAEITSGGFDKTYSNKNAFSGDTGDVKLNSGSVLFDAILKNNDIVMTMKDFDEVVDDKSLAAYLQRNYDAKRNEQLFNSLKLHASANSLNNSLNQQLGFSLIPNFAQENMNVFRSLSNLVTDNMFSQDLTNERMMVGYDYLGQDRSGKGRVTGYENTANSSYFLADTKLNNRQRFGLGVALTRFNSDYDDDSSRKATFAQVLGSYMHDFGNHWKYAGLLRVGYADGEYKRQSDRERIEGDTSDVLYGFNNELRYNYDLGFVTLEPQFELNAYGYYQRKIKEDDAKTNSLLLDGTNNLSVESGVGLYVSKEKIYGETEGEGETGRIKARFGGSYYRELSQPYHSVRARVRDTDGYYLIESTDIFDRNRMIVRADITFNWKALEFYLRGSQFLEDKHTTVINAGVKYNF